MIKTDKQVPRYYTSNSRDFQLLAHLFDAIFNISRTAIVASDPETLYTYDNKFIQLACNTIGFFNKGEYDANTLQSIIKNFKYLVKNKGKLSAVENAIKLLLNSQHIDKGYLVLLNETNDQLIIYLPTETRSVRLLDELFDYILPAGYTYSIYSQDISTSGGSAQMYLTVDSSVVRFSKRDAFLQKQGAKYKYLMGLDVVDLRLNAADLDADTSTPSVNTQTIAHEVGGIDE